MQKKEYYKHNLPHFQQPGQAYFITWSLKDAVAKHKFKHFTKKLEILKSQIEPGLMVSTPPSNKSRIGIRDTSEMLRLKSKYKLLLKQYLKAYNELLDTKSTPSVDLSTPDNTAIIANALRFWEHKKLKSHAFSIMPNHVHWVVELYKKDKEGNPVYLQDILYSVKRFSATQINKQENRSGALWQKESFDTTIRDEKHLFNVVQYTLNNPINAGFVTDWRKWKGCWSAE